MTPNAAATVPEEARPAVKRRGRAAAGADVPGVTRPMTYEEYLASPEEMARYDIIDGWKVYYTWGAKNLTNPTRDHQRIQGNLYIAFRQFERATRAGQAIQSPCDVLIRSNPTRTRQPDVLFISTGRLAVNPPADNPAPLSPAPELVVEILSPSDTRRVRMAKLADYAAVGVQECWLVSLEAETVELLALSRESVASPRTVAVFGHGQNIDSVAFPGLSVAVDDIFAL